MSDTGTPPRRSLGVMLLDVMLRLAVGPGPSPKLTDAGAPRRRAGRRLLAAGFLAAVATTALLVVVLVRSPDDPAPGPGPAAALPGPQSRSPATSAAVPGSPSAATAATTRTPADPTTKPTPEAPARPEDGSSPGGNPSTPLSASYAATELGLLGYRMTVTVANPGRVARTGWEVTVTFPRPSIEVADVTGATATQDGAVWTFTPDAATRRVAATGSVRVSFSVHGAVLIDAAPTDCRIDTNPCATA